MKSFKYNILSLLCLVALSVYSLTAMAGAQGYKGSSFGQCGTVTGGGNATPTLVSSLSALQTALTRSGSAVIIITKDIEFTTHLSVEVTNKTILALPGVKLYSNVQNSSDSGILYFKKGSSNIILRNLTFVGPGAYDCDGWDNLCFDGVTNAWVDHCDFQDGCDGNFDNKGNTDNITISWCRFHYLKSPKAGGSGGSDDHRFTNLIGSSSSAKPSDGAYTMTWAYCWWDSGCRERMPRVRNADLHMLNCVWTSSVANYYVGPENARVRFDGCYFGSLDASKIFKSYGGTNAAKYNNCYSAKGATLTDTNASKLASISYSYETLSPSVAYSNVTNTTYGAGATLKVTTDGKITEGDGSSSGGGSTPATTTYSVSATAGEGGIASVSASSVESGTSVKFTATPSSGYEFTGWTNSAGTTVSTANPYTVTINENTTLKANFTSNNACNITAATINGAAATISGTSVKATIASTAGTTIPVVLTLSDGATSSAGTSFTMTLSADVGATAGKTITVTAKDGKTKQAYTITLTRAGNVTVLEANGASVAAGGTFTGSTSTTSIKFSGTKEVSDGSEQSPLSTLSGTVYRSSDAKTITLGLNDTSASQIVLAARSTGSERNVTGISVDGTDLNEGTDYIINGTVENNSTVYRVTISGLNIAQGNSVTINTDGNVHYYYFEITPASAVTPATKSSDATLSDLKVNGTTVTGFNAETLTYNVELAAGTTAVPAVTYTVNDANATPAITNAAALPGATTVVVTAEDGSNKTYTINFTVAEPEPTGDSDTFFSAVATTALSVPGSSTNLQITSSNATITGGSMYATNQQTDAKDLIRANGSPSKVAFSITNNTTFFKVVLNQALEAGDQINGIVYTRTDAEQGLWLSTNDSRPGSAPTSRMVLNAVAEGETAWTALPTYTVAEGDGICGETTFYIYRSVGKTVYFTDFTITRGAASTPKSSVCTLSDLKSGGTTVAGFSANTTSYSIELAEGTTSLPAVVVTCTDNKASASVNYGTISNNRATTTVTVTAEDGTQKVYTLNYTVAETAVVTVYNVEATAGTGGSATVSPSGSVVAGSEVTFKATASSGYTFTNWTNGSTVVSTSATYSVEVQSALTLKANFTKQSDTSGRNWNIDGFAAYAGTPSTAHYHEGGTTGGAGGKVVYANSFTELQAYLQSNDPYIILVDHDITTGVTAYVDALSSGKLCDKQDGSEGVATTYGERIMVQSNKTLIGIADANGNAPLISRISLILQCAHNVIIRNCRFTMNSVPILKSGENKIVAMRDGVQTEVGDPDCIGIQADANSASKDSGSHIWIDHCEFFNGNATNVDRYDGLVDIKNNVQWITLSYNYFHDHYKACLFGKGNSDNYDRTVTMHHNMFENIVGSRLPLQRYGHLHYMNNYIVNAEDGYDLRAGAIGYVDACYFKNSKAPVRLRGEGTTNINTDKEYSIVYDNCKRVINNTSYFTYLNAPSNYDEEYTWNSSTNSNTWLPTQTWSGYYVNNHDKVMTVPEVCESYSGAGKVVLWDSYTDNIPAEDLDELKTAALNSPYASYNVDGTKFVPDATEADEYGVKFYSAGVQVGSTQTIVSGAHATAPADPEREGYTFGGWSTDGGTTAVNVATYAITSATNFYAIWTADEAESSELVLTDGETYTATEDKTYADGVTYTRTFSSTLINKWTSLYVPFAINIEDHADKFDVAEIFALCPVMDTNGDGDITAEDDPYLVVFKKTSGNTIPNTPYLVRPKEAITAELTAVDNKAYAAANGTVNCWTTQKRYTFTGVYSSVVANSENDYWYMGGGTLSHKASGSANVGPYRWYMSYEDEDSYGNGSSVVPQSINVLVIGEDIDNATAIKVLRQSKNESSDVMYNLVGMPVDNNTRGIRIKNGNKIIFE